MNAKTLVAPVSNVTSISEPVSPITLGPESGGNSNSFRELPDVRTVAPLKVTSANWSVTSLPSNSDVEVDDGQGSRAHGRSHQTGGEDERGDSERPHDDPFREQRRSDLRALAVGRLGNWRSSSLRERDCRAFVGPAPDSCGVPAGRLMSRACLAPSESLAIRQRPDHEVTNESRGPDSPHRAFHVPCCTYHRVVCSERSSVGAMSAIGIASTRHPAILASRSVRPCR